MTGGTAPYRNKHGFSIKRAKEAEPLTQHRRDDTFRLTLSALLIALMLVLGYVESLIPTGGVPGVKLGLSNGVLIFAVYMLGIPTSYILMALKVVLSGLLFSGVSAMLYAFAGGLISLTLMCLLSRDKKISPVAVSVVGGVSHNVGQVAMAMLVLGAPRQMLVYLGILMLAGLGCGLATGVAANAVMKHLRAARWRLSPGREDKKTGVILMAVAMIVVALGLFFAYRAMKNAAPVALAPQEQEEGVTLLTDGDLPFSLP